MFFESLWQGILFGIATTIAMSALIYAYAIKWEKFTGADKKPATANNAHH